MAANRNHSYKDFDFVVIGAQKAGTTALFHYLKDHPEVLLPDDKEAPFFSRNDRHSKGLEWYYKKVFPRTPCSRVIGTITPQYLCAEYIPRRLSIAWPNSKLVAILRNPIDRAKSHYRMLVARANIGNNIDEYFERLLVPESAKGARELEVVIGNEPRCILVWGEYGRVLEQYYRYFSAEQILVLAYEEYVNKADCLLDEILSFIGLQGGYRPANLGRRYFERGHYQFGKAKRLARWVGLDHILRLMSPEARYELRLLVNEKLGKHLKARNLYEIDTPEMSEPMRRRIVDFYKPDVERLRIVTQRDYPWNEF